MCDVWELMYAFEQIPVHSVMVHLEAGDRKGDKGGGVGGGLVLGDGNVPGQYHVSRPKSV